jgi:tRNA pseudouridine38-40 synthase
MLSIRALISMLRAKHDSLQAGEADSMITRWVCGLSYDGTDYCGWQRQPAGATRKPAVQNVVETALGRIAGHPVATRCAGRTDAGVHALQQVVQFDTPAERPASAWVRGVNAFLPDTVAMRWAVVADDSFDARFGARARTYWYVLIDAPVRPPLWRDRAGWTHRVLDADRMGRAAACLLGRHDFSAFRASECQAATPHRTITSLEVVREGPFLLLSVTADAFLQHMVRNLVGSLVYVGDGRRPVEWVGEVLESRNRSLAAPTFSAAGLYLASVRYDSRWLLPVADPAPRLCELV